MSEFIEVISKQSLDQLDQLIKKLNIATVEVKEFNSISKQIKVPSEANELIKKTTKSTEKLNAEQKEAQRLSKALEREKAKLNKVQSDENKELIKLRERTKQLNKENRENAKEVNGLVSDYDRLRKELKKAEDEYRDLAVTQGLSSKKTKEAQKTVQDLRQEVDDINEPIKRFNDNVGNYASAVPGFNQLTAVLDTMGASLDDVASGSTGVTALFAKLKAGIISATKASLAFIATPIGIALTALASITVITQQFFKFNAEIGKTNRLIEGVANTTGDATDKLRQQATAINRVFGREVKEVARELIELQRDFGTTSEEAFDIYTDGLIRGGAFNEEFGDSIREYGGLLAAAGFNAQEFINILNAGIDLGIYNDKLPDAIKEAGISLNEQTKATRDALINAFGASFSNDILNRINTGQTTIKDALFEISEEAEKAQLNQQQLATITADVFRGAGEDAGGALKIFEAINVSLGIQSEKYTEIEKGISRSVELFNDLEKAKTEAFKSDDAIAFNQELTNIWTNIKIGFFSALAFLRDGFTGITENLEKMIFKFRVTLPLIPTLAKAVFLDFKNILINAAKTAIEYADVINKAMKFDFSGAKEAFNNAGNLSFEFNETKKTLAQIENARKTADEVFKKQLEDRKKALIAQAEFEKNLEKEKEEKAKATGKKLAKAIKEGVENENLDVILSDIALGDIDMTGLEEYQNMLKRTTELMKQLADESKKAFQKDLIIGELSGLLSMVNMDVNVLASSFETLADKSSTAFEKQIALADGVGEVVNGIGQTIFQNEQIRLQNQLALNSEYYNNLIQQASGNAEQQELLRREQAQKERQIRQKQAENDKRAAIFEIAINTAAAIVKALPNIPLSIAIGAIGAAKLALVSSRPVPQFKKGRKGGPETWAILGDGYKNEPIIDKKGNLKAISPNKPTMMHLDKDDSVLPNMDLLSDQIMLANVQASASRMTKDNQNKGLERMLAMQSGNIEKGVMKALKKAKFVNVNNTSVDLGYQFKVNRYKGK